MRKDVQRLLHRLLPQWRAALPSSVTERDLDDFFRRNEAQVLSLLEERVPGASPKSPA